MTIAKKELADTVCQLFFLRGGFAANRAYGNQRLPYAKLVFLPPRHDLRPEHRADGACLLQPQLALQRLHGLARRGAEHTVRRDERDAPARAGDVPQALLHEPHLLAAVALHENGVLAKYGVEMIGANFDAIQRGEDREKFKDIVSNLDVPGAQPESARSFVCHTLDEVLAAADERVAVDRRRDLAVEAARLAMVEAERVADRERAAVDDRVTAAVAALRALNSPSSPSTKVRSPPGVASVTTLEPSAAGSLRVTR